jgi:hypothetical protein
MGEARSKAAITTNLSIRAKAESCDELPGNASDMPHIACLPPGNRDPHAMARWTIDLPRSVLSQTKKQQSGESIKWVQI